MNKKGFASIAVVVLIVALIGVVGYFFLQKPSSAPSSQVKSPTTNQASQNNQKFVLSSENVFFSSEHQGEIALSSMNVATRTVAFGEKILCIGGDSSRENKKEYQGDFQLSFEGKIFSLGQMMFVEGTPFDGILRIEKLSPNNNQDFILLSQHGNSCDTDLIYIYGYDFVGQKLTRYEFVQNGKHYNNLSSASYVEPNTKREVFSSVWDDSLSRVVTTKWKFDDKAQVFNAL